MHIGSRGLGTVLLGFVICEAAGCGGGSGTPTFATSLPASATVETLSSSQQQQLCDEATSFGEMLLRSPGFCQAMGVSAAVSDATSDPNMTDADIQNECSTLSQFCQVTLNYGTSSSTCDPTTCAVTVGELTACMNDTGTAFHAYASSVPPCSALTRAMIATLGPGPNPPSCAVVSQQCPGVDTGNGTSY